MVHSTSLTFVSNKTLKCKDHMLMAKNTTAGKVHPLRAWNLTNTMLEEPKIWMSIMAATRTSLIQSGWVKCGRQGGRGA